MRIFTLYSLVTIATLSSAMRYPQRRSPEAWADAYAEADALAEADAYANADAWALAEPDPGVGKVLFYGMTGGTGYLLKKGYDKWKANKQQQQAQAQPQQQAPAQAQAQPQQPDSQKSSVSGQQEQGTIQNGQ